MTQTESTANEIKLVIAEIKKLDVENDLVRVGSLGDWAFKELRNEFKQMKVLLMKLEITELTNIHLPILSDLSRDLNALLVILRSITKFGVAQDRAEQAKNSIINNFNEQFAKVLDRSARAFQMLDLTNDIIVEGSLEYHRAEEPSPVIKSEELEKEVKAAQEKLRTALTEMESALAAVRAKSKEVGVERYSKIFGDESKKYFNTSIVWLILTVLLLVAGIGYGYNLNEGLVELAIDATKSKLLDNNNYVLQITIIRLLTITILFYALTICMKNYRAQKHNQIINRHRHNALTTFETFSAGATDEGTKNAVLLEATRAIFGNQSTGFGSKDSDVESPTSQVIEILKTRSNTKSS